MAENEMLVAAEVDHKSRIQMLLVVQAAAAAAAQASAQFVIVSFVAGRSGDCSNSLSLSAASPSLQPALSPCCCSPAHPFLPSVVLRPLLHREMEPDPSRSRLHPNSAPSAL